MELKRIVDFFEKEGIEYKLNENIASYISFKVGGEAIIIAIPDSYDKLCLAVRYAYLEGIRYFILGNGTNVYFSSSGYGGLVILTKKLDSISSDGSKIVASCGASLTKVSLVARDNSLSGLEFAYGIPASCGGAVYMNAAAYGGEISNIVACSVVYDPINGRKIRLENEEHCFGRKSSIIQAKKYVLLETCLQLHYGDKHSIETRMKDILHKRKVSQPLDLPSAGSVFVGLKGFSPSYLIDKCGLKGTQIGGAQVSKKHAGFIVNVGNATSDDINELISVVKRNVFNRYGVILKEEIIFVE